MSLVSVAADAAGEIVGDLAGPYVSIFSNARQMGGIIPGITVREVLNDSYTVTVHPVEGGAPISDHYFANPRQLEIVWGWSDSTAGSPGYVQLVLQTIRALAATREPFSVDTGKSSYDSMVIVDNTIPSDVESEFALLPTIRLQEVIITSTDGGVDPSNQADPQTTAATTDMGTQTAAPLGQGGIGGDGKFSAGLPSLTPAGTGGIGRN